MCVLCVFAGEFLEDVHRGLQSRLRPVVTEIIESRVRTRDQLDSLYRRIVSYIVLRSGMGSPADVHTVKEATGRSFIFYFINNNGWSFEESHDRGPT